LAQIIIENLEFKATLGVFETERKSPQRIIAKINLKYDYKKGAYLDYAAIADAAREAIQKGEFELLEDAAQAALNAIITRFSDSGAKASRKTKKAVLALKDRAPRIRKLKITLIKPDLKIPFKARVTDKIKLKARKF
jgi:FolB domain-containing protein